MREGGIGGGGRRCNVELPSAETGGTRGSRYDQLVTVVTEDGRSDPFEDLEVDIVEGGGLERRPEPRLLEVVFDLGRKTRRSEAVAPFLSFVEFEFVDVDVIVVDDVIIAIVVEAVDVVGVDGGDVDTDDRRRKRFIFILFCFVSILSGFEAATRFQFKFILFFVFVFVRQDAKSFEREIGCITRGSL